MNLTQQQIDRLVQGKTVQVVVPKKEGEEGLNVQWELSPPFLGDNFAGEAIVAIRNKNKRVKWQVGKDYAVQSYKKPTPLSDKELKVLDRYKNLSLKRVKDNGQQGIWYDIKTNEIHRNFPAGGLLVKKFKMLKEEWKKHFPNVVPLRFVVKSIHAKGGNWVLSGVKA